MIPLNVINNIFGGNLQQMFQNSYQHLIPSLRVCSTLPKYDVKSFNAEELTAPGKYLDNCLELPLLALIMTYWLLGPEAARK